MSIAESCIIIIYVKDQKKSVSFYKKVLDEEPILDVEGMTEFRINANLKLGIMPNSGIANLICPAVSHPDLAQGIPRCEIYFYVDDPQSYFDRAIEEGGVLVSELNLMDWGDKVCYVADLDGHILAFAEAR